MVAEKQFDIIIIGTGAGGGTLAFALAPLGKRILLLERGEYVPREKDNWNPRVVNVDGKYQTKDIWQDEGGQPLTRTRITTLAAIPSFMERLCSGCERRI